MPKKNPSQICTVLPAAVASVLVALTLQPAEAQRKSIRWATASVDSFGYKVAGSMVKIVEEALGGEYTVTVNPYASTITAMKAAMDGSASWEGRGQRRPTPAHEALEVPDPAPRIPAIKAMRTRSERLAASILVIRLAR
jgi:hypothetical protein